MKHTHLIIIGSLGLGVELPRFGGERGVEHPAHPQIWTLPREIPEPLIIEHKNKKTLCFS